MGERMKAYRCILSPHDFFFYVSKELKIGIPSDIISNLALLYAFNTHIPNVHRIISGTVPHYIEDMKKFTIYSTPGKMLDQNLIIKNGDIEKWDGISRDKKRLTYNAVDTITNTTDSLKAVPSMGQYMKYLPFTPFECFIIGGIGSSIIRLGKKLSAVRVKYQPLENLKIIKGQEFTPSHPVNPNDLNDSIDILECSLEVIPPVPIYRNARLRGDYLLGEVNGKKYKICIPNPKIYESVDMS